MNTKFNIGDLVYVYLPGSACLIYARIHGIEIGYDIEISYDESKKTIVATTYLIKINDDIIIRAQESIPTKKPLPLIFSTLEEFKATGYLPIK